MKLFTDTMLFQFNEWIGISYSGLSLFLSFLSVFFFLIWFTDRQRTQFDLNDVLEFSFLGALGAFIGARIGFIIFYDQSIFLQFKASFPFWAVLNISDGGMSAFGALLGAFIAIALYAIIKNHNTLYFFDLISIAAPLIFFWTRLGQFFSGEILGSKAQAHFIFATKFPQEMYNWMFVEKAKLEQLIVIFNSYSSENEKVITWVDYAQKNELSKAHLNADMISLRNVIQEMIAKFHDGFGSVETLVSPLLNDRHPVQIYGLFFEGIALFLVLLYFCRRPRSPGLMTSVFLILYSITRFGLEYYRSEVEQGPFDFGLLTRGQSLSVGAFVFGLLLLIFVSKASNIPTQGWGRGQNVRYNRR